MYIGGSIFLIALGAILSFAIQDSVDFINLVTTGYILMIAGALGLIFSVIVNGQNNGGNRIR